MNRLISEHNQNRLTMQLYLKMRILMKMKIELSDALFEAVKALAQSRQTTMKALVEDGLCRVLQDANAVKQPAFKLENASVGGGQMPISNSRQWQDLESDHIAKNIVQPAKR
jgi:hypothetical protein